MQCQAGSSISSLYIFPTPTYIPGPKDVTHKSPGDAKWPKECLLECVVEPSFCKTNCFLLPWCPTCKCGICFFKINHFSGSMKLPLGRTWFLEVVLCLVTLLESLSRLSRWKLLHFAGRWPRQMRWSWHNWGPKSLLRQRNGCEMRGLGDSAFLPLFRAYSPSGQYLITPHSPWGCTVLGKDLENGSWEQRWLSRGYLGIFLSVCFWEISWQFSYL